MDMNKFKFAVTMLLTPLADPMVMMLIEYTTSEEERANYIDSAEMARQKSGEANKLKLEIQFWAIALLFLIAILSKAYREEFCNNFSADPITDRLEEIRQRYQVNKLTD